MYLMNMIVNELFLVLFQCNVLGDLKLVVIWFKGGVQLVVGGRIVIGGDSLIILNIVVSDVGQYSCNVSNGLSFYVGIVYLFV